MKQKITLLGLLFLIVMYTSAQKTITLQPGSEGKDATVERIDNGNWQNINFGNEGYLRAMAWTFSGDEGLIRFLIEFDLSTIPTNSIIQSAKLSLYHNGSSQTQSGLSGSNEMLLERITEPWNETTVTWNNQPKSTTINQLIIPQTTNDYQDITDIDITPLVIDMYENNTNYGLLFKLKTEEIYRRMIFASSDFPDEKKRPKLVITYNESSLDTCYVTVYDTIRTEIIDTVRVEILEKIYQHIAVTDTLVIDVLLTGNNSLNLAGAIKMFPNPTNQVLNITIDNYELMVDYSIKIIDTNGKIIFNSSLSSKNFQVSFDQFAQKGLFFVQIIDKQMNILDTRKILLK